MSEPILKIVVAGDIATLTMNCPAKRNAMCDARLEAVDGLSTEILCAALTQTNPDAREGLATFLEKRPPAFR